MSDKTYPQNEERDNDSHSLSQLRNTGHRSRTLYEIPPSRPPSEDTNGQDHDRPVSDNKNIQAAFDQLTRRQSPRAGTADSLHPEGSVWLPRSPFSLTSDSHNSVNTIPNNEANADSSIASSSPSKSSFTQRRLERGGPVPSSFSSFDWSRFSGEQGLSSSVGSLSNDLDSSAYYGLSPFVTSSFMETPTPERLGSTVGTTPAGRYQSLWQRYQRERADIQAWRHEEEEQEEEQLSPEVLRMSPSCALQRRPRGRDTDGCEESTHSHDDSDIELSDDEPTDPSKKDLSSVASPFLFRLATRRFRQQDTEKDSPSGAGQEPVQHRFDVTNPASYEDDLGEKQEAESKKEDMKRSSQLATEKTSTMTGGTNQVSVESAEGQRQPASRDGAEVVYKRAEPLSSSPESKSPETAAAWSHVPRPDSFDRLKQTRINHRPLLLPTQVSAKHDMGSESHDALWRLGFQASSPSSLLQPSKADQPPRLQHPAPRKHLLQTPVFQVVNSNTLKERYLFLFSDLLLICKPIMDENIIVGSGGDNDVSSPSEGRTSGKTHGNSSLHRFRPNENSLFQVKNIVELSKVTLHLSRDDEISQQHRASVVIGPDGKPVLPPPRKMHPVLASALRKFETNAEMGIAYLVEKQVLANDPFSIGHFLFKTPDINRRQLGHFLADPKNGDIYDAFLDCFRMVALRLDEALRILLMTLRLPSSWESLEYIIERFAKKWHDANQNIVKFHEDMVVKVVVAMLFLNSELWYDASSERDVFWSARERKERKDRQRLSRRASMMERTRDRKSVAIEPLHYISALRESGKTRPSMEDFLDRWKYYDQYSLVPVDFMKDMYRSISAERLETGWDNRTGRASSAGQEGESPGQVEFEQETVITVTPQRFPTRLTKGVPSAPITISIPAPDPGLQIRLRSQDLVCDPSVLDFSKSCVQTFTITGHTPGRTSLMFIKSGHNANRYVSPTLPRTKTIFIERPFMRYTFEISFSHADIRAAARSTPPATNSSVPVSPNANDKEKESMSKKSLHLGDTEQQGQPPLQSLPAMVERRYMFSVESEAEKREWIHWLKTLCGDVQWSGKTSETARTMRNIKKPAKVLTAEESVALQVLKELLLADEYKKGTANVTVLRSTLLGNATGTQQQQIRSSMIDVASTHNNDSPTATTASKENAESLWSGVPSPGNEDLVFLDKDKNAGDRDQTTKTAAAAAAAAAAASAPASTTNVVTKRGHEIIKLVVQNSMVPLVLGFLRQQIQ